jgi:histidyl-tRNA synthetase
MAPHTTLHDPLLAQVQPDNSHYNGPEDFATALSVARHYGFHLIEPIEPDDDLDKQAAKHQGDRDREKTGEWYIHLGDKLAELKHYIENFQNWPQPVSVCHSIHPRRKVGQVRLNMYGCHDAVAEGLTITTTLAILRELGHENLGVEINCLGDHSTKEKFTKRFKNHVKRNLEDMRPRCQTLFKQDPLRFTTCDHDICSEITKNGPNPVDYLKKADRNHLKEVCEYLESLSVPYRINTALAGSHHHHSHTLFQVKEFSSNQSPHDEDPLARGERHFLTPGNMGHNCSIHTISASVDVPGGKRQSFKPADEDEVETPDIYYLHLGQEARKYSLPLMETLRQRGIKILQKLTKDRIRDQITIAKRMGVTHAVIAGLQEVRNQTVVVRSMDDRSQQTIDADRLPQFLEKVAL